MTKDDALNFLSRHQPMPSDKDLTQDIIDKYDDVRKFFIKNPDRKAIELFLRSFGEGDGWGVYQLVEDFFYQCYDIDVKKEIKKVLEDITIPDSIRYWVTQIAAAFSDEILRNGLQISLQSKNIDIRDAARMAINQLDEYKKEKLN
ncbi:hypothetical protein [Snodgrassella alvi]|uniref:HEAT repeat domain-containing protein n=1 Tax=Snodgrassella alvi TaxID=1196083 RepID=A0A2N9Y118_9NEIS|nr:hypothetical protein [Snodgrassella alvi]PIT58700.1 hypothetical protein BHC49_00985 [Snodgrassella alvi]